MSPLVDSQEEMKENVPQVCEMDDFSCSAISPVNL